MRPTVWPFNIVGAGDGRGDTRSVCVELNVCMCDDLLFGSTIYGRSRSRPMVGVARFFVDGFRYDTRAGCEK